MIDRLLRFVIGVFVIGCIATGAGWTRPFPEDDHIMAGTRPAESFVNATSESPVKGWLDGIKGRARVGSKLTVRGWAASLPGSASIDRVEVVIDDLETIPCEMGEARADVAAANKRPEWANSGWVAELSLNHILPGEHRFEAVAYSMGRIVLLDGVQYVNVIALR